MLLIIIETILKCDLNVHFSFTYYDFTYCIFFFVFLCEPMCTLCSYVVEKIIQCR